MKRFLTLFSLAFIFPTFGFASGEYDAFMRRAMQQYEQNSSDGQMYMIAGGVGLATSLGLSIRTDDVMPKVGYAVIQSFSSVIILHGAALYFRGDDVVQKGIELRRLDRLLQRQQTRLTADERKAILDAETVLFEKQLARRNEQLRNIRGLLQLTAATSAASTIVFSQPPPALSLMLGMLSFGLVVGGIGDLVTDEPSPWLTPEPQRTTWSFEVQGQQLALGVSFAL